MTTFSIDDGSLGACENVEQILGWLALHASFVDHRAGTVSLDHVRAALQHAFTLGRRAAAKEVPRE